jgi:outer membrane receptor protein involved in Fe transport
VFVDRSNEGFGLPDWKVTAGARYELALGPGIAAASLTWSWQDKTILQSVNNDPTFPRSAVNIDSYSLLNTRFSYELEEYDLELAFFIDNLADEKYVPGALNLSTLGWYLHYAGDPRTYGFEIRKAFGAE